MGEIIALIPPVSLPYIFRMIKMLVALTAALCIPTIAHAMPTDAALRQTLQHRVEKQHWATGIVVGITTPRGHRIVAYGTTTKDGTNKVDGNTVYDVGSLTKVFTALALTDMAAHGDVALDDPVAKYLPPETKLPQDGARQITLADLATHTSGLPLRPNNLVPGNPDNKYAGYTTALLYQFVAGYTPPHGIGTTYDYSNVGFGLLGDALARRANMPYRDVIASHILTPLHLNDTRFTPTPDMQRREAQGYSIDLKPLPHWDMGALESAGGLRSTANDILKFLDAALGKTPSPLSPAFAAMTKTRRPGGMQPATEIALAWNIYTDKDREIVWKNGNVGGYRAFMGYDTKAANRRRRARQCGDRHGRRRHRPQHPRPRHPGRSPHPKRPHRGRDRSRATGPLRRPLPVRSHRHPRRHPRGQPPLRPAGAEHGQAGGVPGKHARFLPEGDGRADHV